MNKAERDQIKRLYQRFDAVKKDNEHQGELSKDVKALRLLSDQKKLVDSLKPGSIAYSRAYNKLLELGYRYYQASGEVDPKSLPGISARDLIQYYNRVHAQAFNLDVQTHVHEFLVGAAPVLMQLKNVPPEMVTNVQLEDVRRGFQQELAVILDYGFARDLAEYQTHLEPKWLVIKMARHLTVDDFKGLVQVMDRYSRLRTGQEKNVGYQPPKEKQKDPNKKPSSEEVHRQKVQERQQKEAQEKAKYRLDIRKDDQGHLIVHVPKDKGPIKDQRKDQDQGGVVSSTGEKLKTQIR